MYPPEGLVKMNIEKLFSFFFFLKKKKLLYDFFFLQS